MLTDVARPPGELCPAVLLAGDLRMVVYVRFIVGVDGTRGTLVEGTLAVGGMEAALRE